MTIEKSIPKAIFVSSKGLILLIECERAKADPVRLAANAWLSLVEMPAFQAVKDQAIVAVIAAHKVKEAGFSLLPKSASLNMVCATPVLTAVMTKIPRDSKKAAKTTALEKDKDLVVTHVTMLLGATLKPLIKISEAVRTKVISVTGSVSSIF